MSSRASSVSARSVRFGTVETYRDGSSSSEVSDNADITIDTVDQDEQAMVEYPYHHQADAYLSPPPSPLYENPGPSVRGRRNALHELPSTPRDDNADSDMCAAEIVHMYETQDFQLAGWQDRYNQARESAVADLAVADTDAEDRDDDSIYADMYEPLDLFPELEYDEPLEDEAYDTSLYTSEYLRERAETMLNRWAEYAGSLSERDAEAFNDAVGVALNVALLHPGEAVSRMAVITRTLLRQARVGRQELLEQMRGDTLRADPLMEDALEDSVLGEGEYLAGMFVEN